MYREEVGEAASSYVIVNSEEGSRTIVNWNGLREMGVEEFIGRAVEVHGAAGRGGVWWHFEVSMSIHILFSYS